MWGTTSTERFDPSLLEPVYSKVCEPEACTPKSRNVDLLNDVSALPRLTSSHETCISTTAKYISHER